MIVIFAQHILRVISSEIPEFRQRTEFSNPSLGIALILFCVRKLSPKKVVSHRIVKAASRPFMS